MTYLVIGGKGKENYVKERAREDDAVILLDRLAEAGNIFVVCSTPTVEQLEKIEPDMLVWCRHDFDPREDQEQIDKLTDKAIEWCDEKNIPIYCPLP